MTAPAALAFDAVSKRYRKGVLALDGVTWAIGMGARACLLGPNGAGKSTAIRLLQGALRPTTGHVTLLGTPVDDPAYLDARRRTGIVPQGPGMYRDLSVAEYLELARRLYGRGQIAAVADVFGLAPYLGTRMAELSGGFQRRVALAAALLGEPDLLLLDEPTVGLDPVAASEVHAYLRQAMARPGRTTLLCTHNLAEAEALCDEVVILRAGTVLVHEPLEQLRQRARPRLRLAARQGVAPVLAALRTRGFQPGQDSDDAVWLPVVDAPREVPPLLRGLLADGLDVYEARVVRPSLEALFLDLVKGA